MRKLQKQCYVCYNNKMSEQKRKDMSYKCTDFDVAECIHSCFQKFQTKKKKKFFSNYKHHSFYFDV